jgi:hypothetical protein
MSIEWCTETDGIEWFPQKVQAVVTNALWYAAKSFEFALRALGSLVLLFLPSGIKIGVLIDDFVPDFRIDVKKYHAIRLTIGKTFVLEHALPKSNFREIWQAFVGQKDWYIEDSEYWTYHKDPEDGIYKPGSWFDPVKQYGILRDGVIDIGSVLLIVAIGYALYASGIPKMAVNFIKNTVSPIYKASRVYKNTMSAKGYTEIAEDVDDIVDFFDDNEKILKAIQSRLGVRLVIGK